ncbi:MAG: lysylphosphatidylglycerol synthase transmembrane domain-containing protein [Myxococcota bacterium]
MRLKIAAVLAVTVLCLGWVLWGIDLAVVRVSLGEFRWERMIAVFAIYGAAHSLRVLRLRVLLDRPLAFRGLFGILSIGYLAIHVVPLRLGEFVRPWLLAEKEGVPFGEGLAAVFVERLLDMLMLLGMFVLVGFFVEVPAGALVVQGVDVLVAGQRAVGAMVGAGALGLVVLLVVGEPLLRITDRLPMGGFARRFVEGLRQLARRPAACVAVLALSAVIWGITVGAVQITLGAFPGLPARLDDALITWTVTLAGMTAVPTPGFFGGFEAACTAALVMLGGDADRARTFAVLLHVGQFGFTVAIGVVFLVLEGLSLRELVDQSRKAGVA